MADSTEAHSCEACRFYDDPECPFRDPTPETLALLEMIKRDGVDYDWVSDGEGGEYRELIATPERLTAAILRSDWLAARGRPRQTD